ncbi:NAD(P)-dependent oxidoreductase [Nocardia brasiliensis]
MIIGILGASGPLGRELVAHALIQGHWVRALVRDPAGVSIADGGLTVVAGDARDQLAVDEVVEDVDVVVNLVGSPGAAASTIRQEVTPVVLKSMQRHGVSRLVAISVGAVEPGLNPAGWVAAFLFRKPLRDSRAMEALVRESAVEWTIARSTRLTDTPARGRYRVSTRGTPFGAHRIGRSDLAQVLLTIALSDEYIHKTCTIGY